METIIEIEKLKEKYNELLRELNNLEKEHNVLEKEYKEFNMKIFDINDRIDDIEEEIMTLIDNRKDEEIKYVSKEKNKIFKRIMIETAIISTLATLVMGGLSIPQTLVTIGMVTIIGGPLACCIVLNRKRENKIRNKYRQTENYIKNSKLIEQKMKKISELKNEKVSLEDRYEIYKKISNLEKQIEAKQKEIEDIKEKVFEIFFGGTKEEITNEQVISYCDEEKKTSPLVKTRRINN